MRIWGMAIVALAALTACSRANEPTDKPAPAISPSSVFELTPSERDALQEQAAHGDGDAAFRLAQYYGIAGGDGADEATNSAEVERWLRVAAAAGHETAKLNLAVDIALRDCDAGRKMLTELQNATADPRTRRVAQSWLSGEDLCDSRASNAARK